jgi:AbrB family looped-hinge helix DNA binding protein
MRITSKGQVTIPLPIREKMGFLPYMEVEFKVIENEVHLVKAEMPAGRGNALVEKMRGKATVKMTTDEILALTRN